MTLDTVLFAAGGLLCCAGGTNLLKAGPGAVVSELIKVECPAEEPGEFALSHVIMALPQKYWLDPKKPRGLESTIWKGVSGPQINDLEDRLTEDYEKSGGHVALYRFLPAYDLDWAAVWACGQQLIAHREAGKLHYSIERLFEDAAVRIPYWRILLPLDLVVELGKHDDGLVCSEEVGLLERAGGLKQKLGELWLPNSKLGAGCIIGCTPEDVRDMPVFFPPDKVG